MKLALLSLALGAQLIMVAGQILLKRAMTGRHRGGGLALRLAGAIGLMTVYFFLWLGILNHVPLSQLAPFDALGPVLLVAAAHIALRERLSVRAWLGAGCIMAGVGVIAFS